MAFSMLSLVWILYKQDQKINALGDFIMDRLGEVDEEAKKSKEWETQVQEFILNQILPEIAYQDYKIDRYALDYYRHIAYNFHLDEKQKPFRPLQVFDQEIALCNLEKSVRTRADQYKDRLNPIRPEGI